MATWLLKTEPDAYSYADLAREKKTVWDGVTNPAAMKHMRGVKKDDACFIYHTGDEKRIAGLAKVVKGAYEDPAHQGEKVGDEPKFVLFEIAPVREAKGRATLADVKKDKRFAGFDLVRLPRLSVIPVPPEIDAALREMAGL